MDFVKMLFLKIFMIWIFQGLLALKSRILQEILSKKLMTANLWNIMSIVLCKRDILFSPIFTQVLKIPKPFSKNFWILEIFFKDVLAEKIGFENNSNLPGQKFEIISAFGKNYFKDFPIAENRGCFKDFMQWKFLHFVRFCQWVFGKFLYFSRTSFQKRVDFINTIFQSVSKNI